MAEHVVSTSSQAAPATKEAFNNALSEAALIVDIVRAIADGELTGGVASRAAHYSWLADEISARLEVIDSAGLTLRSARA